MDTADSPTQLVRAPEQLVDADQSAASSAEAEAELLAEVADLEATLVAEKAALELVLDECKEADAELALACRERFEAEAEVEALRSAEGQRQSSGQLVRFQLNVQAQLLGVAETLAHVPAAAASGESAAAHQLAETERHHERTVAELQRALQRQQLLTSDAHRQLLELATSRRPLGAAAGPGKRTGGSPDTAWLQAQVADQEMGRMVAEARVDELQAQVRLLEEHALYLPCTFPVPSAQVRLLEEHALRSELHPPPLGLSGQELAHELAAAGLVPASGTSPAHDVDEHTPEP